MPMMNRTSIASMELLLPSKRVQAVRKVDAKAVVKVDLAVVAIEIVVVAGVVDVVPEVVRVTAVDTPVVAVAGAEDGSSSFIFQQSKMIKKGRKKRPFCFIQRLIFAHEHRGCGASAQI
jgi:hypothetical protein